MLGLLGGAFHSGYAFHGTSVAGFSSYVDGGMMLGFFIGVDLLDDPGAADPAGSVSCLALQAGTGRTPRLGMCAIGALFEVVVSAAIFSFWRLRSAWRFFWSFFCSTVLPFRFACPRSLCRGSCRLPVGSRPPRGVTSLAKMARRLESLALSSPCLSIELAFFASNTALRTR